MAPARPTPRGPSARPASRHRRVFLRRALCRARRSRLRLSGARLRPCPTPSRHRAGAAAAVGSGLSCGLAVASPWVGWSVDRSRPVRVGVPVGLAAGTSPVRGHSRHQPHLLGSRGWPMFPCPRACGGQAGRGLGDGAASSWLALVPWKARLPGRPAGRLTARGLPAGMLEYEPAKRFSIQQIRQHRCVTRGPAGRGQHVGPGARRPA